MKDPECDSLETHPDDIYELIQEHPDDDPVYRRKGTVGLLEAVAIAGIANGWEPTLEPKPGIQIYQPEEVDEIADSIVECKVVDSKPLPEEKHG